MQLGVYKKYLLQIYNFNAIPVKISACFCRSRHDKSKIFVEMQINKSTPKHFLKEKKIENLNVLINDLL